MSDISSEIVGQNQPVADSQPSGASLDFSSLHEKAMAFGSDTPASTEGGTEQVTTPEQPVIPSEPAISEGQNIDGATSAQLATLKDTDLVEVTVDGQPVTMPWKDAKGGLMRQAKFTKEMQALRQREEQFGAERGSLQKLAEEREALVKFLESEELVKQFIQKQYPNLLGGASAQQPAATPQGGVDPDDIATVGQIEATARQQQEVIQKYMDDVREQLSQHVEKVTQTIEERQQAAKLMSEVNSTISSLFNEHSYISKVIPNAEQMLRFEVLQMKPQTAEETLEAFKTVFGGWVENYKASVAETTKQSVLQKQQLEKNNVMPPGGSPVTPQQPAAFKTKDGKVNWDALRQVALDRLG